MAQPKKTLLNIPKTKVAASTEIPSTRSKLHAPGADRPQRTGVQLYLACCAVRIQVLTRPRTSVRATVAPPEHAEVFIFKPFRALLSRGVFFFFLLFFVFASPRLLHAPPENHNVAMCPPKMEKREHLLSHQPAATLQPRVHVCYRLLGAYTGVFPTLTMRS